MAQVWKDRYEIERPLGRGGMSAVYLAKDRQLLSKRVVVKVLLDDMSEDAWVRQKFFQEMEALARIDHPGVVGVLDTGQTPDGKQFLVMQYVEGQTLRSAIAEGGMPIHQAATLIRQIAQALGAAHDAGVWHRDLKPENIMLQRSGNEDYAKLIDFGIAGIQNSQFTGEKTKIAGSLSYMAPEQFAGNPCAASDIYALGVVAYEMLTGNAPFGSSSMTHLVAEDLTVVLPRNARPEITESAERAMLRAMSFQPENRQKSVREFGDQVYAALCDITEPTRRTFEEPTRRTPGREGSLEMAHVLFMDLVGYSRLPMDRQKQHLAELQAVVRSAPRFHAAERAEDLISLPTGDGMALVFFGDPSAAAQCAIEVAAALKEKPHLQLRMGIHTGPVYRVADVNANANVAGGGINIAQRVMDCGDAGHILVSKTVADVLMQLSDWGPCLCDLGEQVVKHGEKVHLYNLATADAGNPSRPSKLAPQVVETPKKSKAGLAAAVAAVVILGGAGAGWMVMRPKSQPSVERAQAPLELNYQPMGDGKLIWFQVAPSESGFLYFLNYGKEDNGSWTFRLLFPMNGGSAARPAGESLRLPTTSGFTSNTPDDKNEPYFVWSRKPIPEMETLKSLRQDHGAAVVEGPQVEQVNTFLKRYEAPNDQVLIRKISLEKR